jgi:hypothetical protein
MTRFHATPEGNVPFTPEEEAEWDAMEAQHTSEADTREAKKVRQKRNQLIQQTDWRAVSDRTLSDEWRDYRQALRDIPAQPGFPNDVIWPSEPS